MISIPRKRNFTTSFIYPDLSTPRAISGANILRGLFQITLTDSLDPLLPRKWQILVEGGTNFVGDDAKYFILTDNTAALVGFNITSVVDITRGFEYDIIDAFGNTYRLVFNGARDFVCTIEQTAGAALTGPVTIESLLFPFTDEI